MNTHSEHFDTIVVGGGQAGLSVGYHLAQTGRSFLILNDLERVGDNWRNNWDTLRLYSPARVDALPGLPFPAPPWSHPDKDQMGDYLESYAEKLRLPVRSGVRVKTLSRTSTGYQLATSHGLLEADNVVVATGTFGRTPRVPEVAGELDPSIRQLHSSEYRRPAQLLAGPTLVVGASHSGADIAFELGPHHDTVLCGPIHGQVPLPIDSRPAAVVFRMMFFVASHLLTIKTPIGRKMRPEIRAHGGPLLRVKKRDLARVGVEWVEDKVVGADQGRPMLANGRVLDVANVVWCTGFRQDFGWIDLPVIGADGWPEENRGVVEASPGLYFCGLAFQFGFTSMLVGGAGSDAKYVADHIASRTAPASRPERLREVS